MEWMHTDGLPRDIAMLVSTGFVYAVLLGIYLPKASPLTFIMRRAIALFIVNIVFLTMISLGDGALEIKPYVMQVLCVPLASLMVIFARFVGRKLKIIDTGEKARGH